MGDMMIRDMVNRDMMKRDMVKRDLIRRQKIPLLPEEGSLRSGGGGGRAINM
jgi:hypothetical protein